MNSVAKVCVVLALTQGALFARAAEPEPQPMSPARVVSALAFNRFSMVGDICVRRYPATKAAWDQTLSATSATTDRVVGELVTSPVFNSLEKVMLPSDAASAFLRGGDASKQELQDRVAKLDLDSWCPQSLKRIQTLNVEYLKAVAAQMLAGIQIVLEGQKQGYIN